MAPRIALPMLLSLVISACGGGGGGAASAPPVAAQPVPAPVPAPAPAPVPAPVPADPAPVPAPVPVPEVPVVPAPPPTPPTPPTPLAQPVFAPATGLTGMARTAALTASFGSNLAAPSVNAGNVALLTPGGAAMPIGLAVSGSQLRVTPLAPLPGDTTYTLRIGTGVADADGRVLSAPASASFTTAAQEWKAQPMAVLTLPKGTPTQRPLAAVDSAGNVTATWQTYDGSNTLESSRFDVASGTWSTPATIARVASGERLMPAQLVSVGNGDMIQLWYEVLLSQTPSQSHLRQSRFDSATSTWGASTPLALLPAGHAVEAAEFVADEAGRLTVLMSNKTLAGEPALYAARLDRASGTWSTAQRIDRPGKSTRLFGFTGAADRAGNVSVVWTEPGADATALVTARYDIASGRWSAGQVLAPDVVEGGGSGTLAVNASGAAIAIWKDREPQPGALSPVQVARFSAATQTWTPPFRIDRAGKKTGFVQVALDAAGYAVASWIDQGSLDLNVVATRFEPVNLQWSTPQTVSKSGKVWLEAPKLAVDAAGNATLVFIESKKMNAVRFRSSDQSWSSPVLIGTHATGSEASELPPALVVDRSGVATVVWCMTNWIAWFTVSIYDNEISANRFQ